MEILAEKEAVRLALFHLAQAFGVADAEKIEQIQHGKVLTIRLLRNGKASVGEVVPSEKGKAGRDAALGLAFAESALAAGGRTPPYGTLTGVRPVKVALRYLGAGRTESVRRLEKVFLVAPEKAALLAALAETEARETEPDEVMLYISIPFCPSRCRYCSFISSSAPDHLTLIPAYLDLLKEEIALTGEGLAEAGKRVSAVYVGGGTPGILSAKQMRDLLCAVRASFGKEIPEFSFEAGRPDTVTEEKLAVLAEAGVDRICVNPQTTRDEVLQINGRSHSAEDFYHAMELTRSFPFKTVNCDLIAGLTGDDAPGFLASVKKVLDLAPENITIHALCRKRAAADRADRTEGFPGIREAVSHAHRLCMDRGLAPYYLYRQKMAVAGLENLGFTEPGHLCRYNLCMMEDLCHVAACGAGAIGKVLPPRGGKIRRFPRPKYPFEYLAQREKIHGICRDFTAAIKELA